MKKKCPVLEHRARQVFRSRSAVKGIHVESSNLASIYQSFFPKVTNPRQETSTIHQRSSNDILVHLASRSTYRSLHRTNTICDEPTIDGGREIGITQLVCFSLSSNLAREFNFLVGVDRSIRKFAYTLTRSVAGGQSRKRDHNHRMCLS